MSSQSTPYVPPQDYLLADRRTEHHAEYLDGMVVPLAADSRAHEQIVSNLASLLGRQLEDQTCALVTTNLRLQLGAGRHYFYPDAMVICGEAIYADEHNDTLLNPVIIVEVLSPTTIDYDRGEKFLRYRTLSSLAEYLVIAESSYHIEHFVRRKDNTWVLTDINYTDVVINLYSIACQLAVAEIYAQVEIPALAG